MALLPMIRVENVGIAYGSPPRPVLDAVDLEIKEGEFVCVLGQTGCGKSTLLRLLLGSERPASGRILIDGREHRQPDRSRGYVPQRYALFPDRTVLDNITFGPEVSEFNLLGPLTPAFYRRRRELRAQALEGLLRIGLRESDAGKYPEQLSGGMQQRVAVAQALMTKPRILLMDEAFSALDPGTRREMQQLIRDLCQSTCTTVLFVTHNTQEALRVGSRVVVLARETPDHGSRVVLDLKVPDISRDEDLPELVRCLENASEGKPGSRPDSDWSHGRWVDGNRTAQARSMRVKRTLVLASCGVCLSLSVVSAQAPQSNQPGESGPPRPPHPGVSTPGARRDIETIKPIAAFPVEGAPDRQVVTADAVWVSNGPKNTVHRLDPKTNTVVAAVEVGKSPCSGLAAAFGSIWVPNCTDMTLSRLDPKTNKVTAALPVGPAASEGGLTANADSVWILSDPKGILSRIDPEANRLVAEIQVPPGSSVCVVGEDGAIWVVSTEKGMVVRVDPNTNLITDRIAVGPQPRVATAGGGAIWTLNQGGGTVSRIDVKTKKLITNIDVGASGGGGDIAYGEGYVWVTMFDIPLSQIDPDTNKVIKQWMGPGGDAVRVGHGSVWLSNRRQQNVWRIDPKQP